MAKRPEEVLSLPGADAVLAVESDVGTVEDAEQRLQSAECYKVMCILTLVSVSYIGE